MSDTYLETCRICKIVVPVENNIFQIYDNACVKFLEEIKEISGVDFNGVFEQPWYICMNCYTSLLSAQVFRKKCIESYEIFKNSQKLDEPLDNEDLLEKILNYRPDVLENESSELEENKSTTNSNPLPAIPNEVTVETVEPIKTVATVETNKTVEPVETVKTIKTVEIVEAVNNRQSTKKDVQITRICEICGNVFEKKRNFKLHLQRHTNIKRYECEICFCKFYTPSELKCHMRKHTGEKPYKCKYCNRKFSDYGTHKNHERTHTNERPFSCNFCEKTFTNQFMQKNHILIHTGKRNYKCDVCNRAFVYPGHLTTHLKSMFHRRNCKLAELEEKELTA
ncbi:transcription factor Ouib-like [Episyrphus balteatus]|uniref:transcription factor Ouib-like n=1 Tax=Episyrphus balteatus TaxID=286459 RepID=UPI002485CB4A|nr:transcription factor Ouib-like [Episyrphus balteatus]